MISSTLNNSQRLYLLVPSHHELGPHRMELRDITESVAVTVSTALCSLPRNHHASLLNTGLRAIVEFLHPPGQLHSASCPFYLRCSPHVPPSLKKTRAPLRLTSLAGRTTTGKWASYEPTAPHPYLSGATQSTPASLQIRPEKAKRREESRSLMHTQKTLSRGPYFMQPFSGSC